MAPSESVLFPTSTRLRMLRLIEYRCYCGCTVARGSIPVPDAWCTNTCSGDSSQICGGSDKSSLYETGELNFRQSGRLERLDVRKDLERTARMVWQGAFGRAELYSRV